MTETMNLIGVALQGKLRTNLERGVYAFNTSDMQGLFGASLSEKRFVGLESKAIDRTA
jgi:hypothetical protein